MIASDCPKFERCSAPICPLDSQPSVHLTGEPICFYLQEVVKNGGFARISAYTPGEMAKNISLKLPEITSRYADIKTRLDRCSMTGSRIDNFKKEAA